MVTLRSLAKEDLPFLLEVRNDYSTRNNLENNSTFTLEQCENWFDNLKSSWYIIEVNKVSVGYLRTNGDEVGCDIHPDFRRKGYAKMAYELYLKDKTYASLWVFNDNFAKDLYLKLGFKEIDEHEFVRDRNYIKMEYEKHI
jgi:RimJ/RimL family protein N-acetyltransferase